MHDAPGMFRVVVLSLVIGCAGPMTPGVTPLLSELPVEGEHRDAILDSANAPPSPEQQRASSGLTRKQRRALTAAATAAAVLGALLSGHGSALVGVSQPMDENLIDSDYARQQREKAKAKQKAKAAPQPVVIPWIDLSRPTTSGDTSRP
jgi:hypothetical protein